MVIQLNKKIKYILGLLSLILIGLSSYYYVHRSSSSIRDFNANNIPFILDIFKQDMYWLSANPDFSSIEYLIAHKSSSKNPKHEGNLTIKVGYENNQPTGFVAYHPVKFYIGRILFLDVIPEFRSKGWGYKLLDYAMKDLLKQGFSKITITTRTNNFPALKLYTRYGFKEVRRDENFVDLEYTIS